MSGSGGTDSLSLAMKSGSMDDDAKSLQSASTKLALNVLSANSNTYLYHCMYATQLIVKKLAIFVLHTVLHNVLHSVLLNYVNSYIRTYSISIATHPGQC